MTLNEADTCRVYVPPSLRDSGWETPPHSLTEQYTFTDGRVEFAGNRTRRGEQKRADYLLHFLLAARGELPTSRGQSRSHRGRLKPASC